MKDQEQRRHKKQRQSRSTNQFEQSLGAGNYVCSGCDGFFVSGSTPYFKAIAKHGKHNTEQHPTGMPPFMKQN